MITKFATDTHEEHAAFRARFAILSVQRNLRILGIFARLILRDKKPKYLPFMPILWTHLQTDLAHPALKNLRDVVDETLPPPHQSALKDLL